MRVAAISDIHGNMPALEAVLADVAREDVETVVVVGDTISGPWPVEAFDAISRLDAEVVRGNADRVVIERDDRYGGLALWCADLLGDERLAIAARWPLTIELEIDGLGRVLFCHSAPTSDEPIYTRITPDAAVAEILGQVDADLVVCGHTHMQYDRVLGNGLRLVNPGSVGMPYEGRTGAFWAVLGPDVDFRHTRYEIETTADAVRASGAPVDEQLVSYLTDPPTAEETTEYFESLRGA